MVDLRELGPTYFFAPSRIFESILTQFIFYMDDAHRAQRPLFHSFPARVSSPLGCARCSVKGFRHGFNRQARAF
jgi:hypothetical protein